MIASAATSEPASQYNAANPLGFHKPAMHDIAWAKPILFDAKRMGCEFCFGNIYAWCLKYGTEITQQHGFFLSRSRSQTVYCMPIGSGDLRQVIPLLQQDAKRNGGKLKLYGLNAQDIPHLEEAYPGVFSIERCLQDDFDYIYRRDDLSTLVGKKYHQKRNHIARFVRECSNWYYEEITPALLDEVLNMEQQWAAQNAERNPEGFAEELVAFERCLKNFELFELRGALLRENGPGSRVIAFTMGEALNTHTFCTHYEKAYAGYTGAYQMINRCFAEQTLADFQFINREEDLGHEGLRKAKLSYHPTIVLEKYFALEK